MTIQNSYFAGGNSDGYVRTTVYLATVLFLVGISGHFRVRAARLGLIGIGGFILVQRDFARLRMFWSPAWPRTHVSSSERCQFRSAERPVRAGLQRPAHDRGNLRGAGTVSPADRSPDRECDAVYAVSLA